MADADLSASSVAGQSACAHRHNGVSGSVVARPLRLTLAPTLGQTIDGAWWPHTARLAAELPELIAALRRPLGEITNINLSWSARQGCPNFNLIGWQDVHQHLMTITGRHARANLLVMPYQTSTALAVLVLRRAAGLPIDRAHRDTPTFQTAGLILRAARDQVHQSAHSSRP